MTEEQQNQSPQTDAQPVAPEATLEELEKLKKALAEVQAKAESNLANWQRAHADFINFRRRCEQEKEEHTKFANAALIGCLLPVLDDFELALACVPPKLAKSDWIQGISLIADKLRETLKTQGLTPIKARGEPFDPCFHEAIMQTPGKEGIVTAELHKGYVFCNRVIRPSRVAVGNGQPEIPPAAESSAGQT